MSSATTSAVQKQPPASSRQRGGEQGGEPGSQEDGSSMRRSASEEQPTSVSPSAASNGHAHHYPSNGNGHLPVPAYRPRLQDASLLPNGKHSLSGISLRAFGLGACFGIGLSCTLLLAWQQNPLWRTPFFITALALFHFLEFFVTAHYNTPLATQEAFILTANGMAYNMAHVSALLETTLFHVGDTGSVSVILGNAWEATTSRFIMASGLDRHFYSHVVELAASVPYLPRAWLALGLLLVVVGQLARSLAMATAGRNFNHLVQTYRRQEHSLVTGGVYGVLRHPSYFGFFWWALGTQMVLGNVFCLAVYAAVLWLFFRDRIRKEEVYLVSFFGKEYREYRSRTWVGIPGIR